jgi:ABC-type Fe3+-hydroxamate transport system substrate-binding protein
MQITDQMKRTIEVPHYPQRIVSLVPSQTELLWYLGLRNELVGITKFCIHPDEMFRSKPRVGGTKKINFDKIKELRPDLIIGNKEENEQGQIEELMKDYPVWMSEIASLEQATDMISRVGELVAKKDAADSLSAEIKKRFLEFNQEKKVQKTFRTGYFIWNDPYMVAGHNTFINEMLKLCGFINVFADRDSRYPEISAEEIIKAKPGLILLSSEPYPFKEKHIAEFKKLLPSAIIKVVDGEIFSWYGNRLLDAPRYFLELIDAIRE